MEGSLEMDLDSLAIELENLESEISTKVDFDAMRRMADDFKITIKSVEDNITSLSGKIDSMGQELEDSGRKYGTYQHIIREMKKLDEKNEEILEEIGFGESMNVSKIPPKILESVYESTIEDIVNEIRKNRGTHDAETIINRTLEDIRTRTSGSELFYFDGRMLKTRNLANSIIHKLISAKQVQTTYDELLRKLLEYLPGYKAKNFRAMIKLKSQEYAVDKTTLLLERVSQFTEDINHLQNMVGSVSNRQNTIELEINNISKSMVAGQELETLTSQMEEFSKKLEEINETLTGLKDAQNSISESLNLKFEDLSNRIDTVERSLKKQEQSLPHKIAPAGVVELVDDEEEETEMEEGDEGPVPLDEDEFRIFSIIPEKGFTFYRIKKEIAGDLSDKKIKEYLESLLVKGVLTTEKRGRHTVYVKPKETEV
jgi:predicted  nucleic acid-binding Zn-ribbon protein